MAEPLRRRLRAGALAALAKAAGGPGDPAVRAVLRSAAFAARWSGAERIAEDNLRGALPELGPTERAALLRSVRRHAVRIVHEWFLMSGAHAERVLASVELHPSCARLSELARAGRGVIICTAHLGNWELLAARLRREGLDGAVVGYRKRKDSMSDWLLELRARHRVVSLAQDDAPRELLRVLRGGGTLGLLCDLEVKRLAGEPVPFFGRPALTMTAPAALARASGLPLVPVRCVARGERYELSVEEPLELTRGSDRRAAELELLTRLNAVYERWIRETPEQWTWYRPRWSAAPQDESARRAARTPLAGRRNRQP